MPVDRARLPAPASYFDSVDLPLRGPGKWKTTACAFHGGSDSMRVNVEHGGWCCMACGAKGGDVLSYVMQRHGLEFVDAARSLGCYIDDGQPRHDERPRTLSARSAMELIAHELLVLLVVISDVRQGLIPNDTDWRRFVEGTGRIEQLASEWT